MRLNLSYKDMLIAALDCARDNGYRMMTRKQVAEYANCAESLVSYYLGSMQQMRIEVIKAAIAAEDMDVIGQAVFFQDPLVKELTLEQKTHAIKTVALKKGGK